MTQRSKVFPEIVALPKHRVSALLAAGWTRGVARVGKGTFADRAETTTRTVDNGLTSATLPEAHTIFNSLAADPTALDELLAAYGFRLESLNAQPSEDLALAGNLAEVTTDLIRGGGRMTPRQKVELADKLRPIICEEEAIVREADHLRGLN